MTAAANTDQSTNKKSLQKEMCSCAKSGLVSNYCFWASIPKTMLRCENLDVKGAISQYYTFWSQSKTNWDSSEGMLALRLVSL